MFGEPARTQYDLTFSLLGIPVRVHPLFWLVALLLGLGGGDPDPGQMLTWVGVVFVSIIVHEMGHALLARSYGWQPWITLYGFGGLASYQPTHHSSSKQILIALAGPMAGFVLAAAVVAGLYVSDREAWFLGWTIGEGLPIANLRLAELVFFLLYVNIFWGLVNLMPLYPLDGGRVARELLVIASPRDGVRWSLMTGVATGALLGSAALVYRRDFYLTFFFGYLAYLNYAALRAYQSGPLGDWRPRRDRW